MMTCGGDLKAAGNFEVRNQENISEHSIVRPSCGSLVSKRKSLKTGAPRPRMGENRPLSGCLGVTKNRCVMIA
jgi:hypothetical protein